MVLLHELFQPLLQDMGIDLSRGNIGVAQELLQGAQVGAAVEQVAREGVAQDVRADALGIEAGFDGELLQVVGETLPGDVPLSTTRWEIAIW